MSRHREARNLARLDAIAAATGGMHYNDRPTPGQARLLLAWEEQFCCDREPSLATIRAVARRLSKHGAIGTCRQRHADRTRRRQQRVPFHPLTDEEVPF